MTGRNDLKPHHCVLTFKVFPPVGEIPPITAHSFLAARLSEQDRERLADLFLQRLVTCNNQIATADQQLSAGDQLQISLPDHLEYEVNSAWQLLWENEELMAVYKPHLLPVSRTTRNLYYTLISLIRRETPYPDAHLLHRLDTETAGIVLVAKNSAADKKWKPRLNQLITRKVYHTWVSGSPDWDQKVCDCLLSEKTGSPIRSQMYVVDTKNPELYPKPKQSKTAFRVLKKEQDKALIECELYTGRKHQIRAQLAYLGYPIIGDKIYSHQGCYYLKRLQQNLNEQDFAVLGEQHHLLTAVSVELTLPEGSKVIQCAVIPPSTDL